MKKVLVTGIGGPAGRATARYFRSKGFSVFGTDIRRVVAESDGFSLVPRADDPGFTRAMLRLIRRERPCLFISTVTEELPHAALMKRRVESWGVKMFTPPLEAVCIANDKFLTARWLGSHDIPIPRTLSDADVEDAMEAGEVLGYPFVAKPRASRGGRGVVVYFDPEGASAETRTEVVYQEFLGGEEYDVNMFIGPDGEASVTRVLLKTMLKDGIVGNALGVRRTVEHDIATLANRTARVMRLQGPADMDIRRALNGVPKVIEVNARIGANVLEAEDVLEQIIDQLRGGDIE